MAFALTPIVAVRTLPHMSIASKSAQIERWQLSCCQKRKSQDQTVCDQDSYDGVRKCARGARSAPTRRLAGGQKPRFAWNTHYRSMDEAGQASLSICWRQQVSQHAKTSQRRTTTRGGCTQTKPLLSVTPCINNALCINNAW